jgi:hypothetical protein
MGETRKVTTKKTLGQHDNLRRFAAAFRAIKREE